MSIIERMLRGTCVYWALKSNESGQLAYDDHGQPLYTDPVELRCRWEDIAEEYLAPDGSTNISRSLVYVESDVEVRGALFNGEIADLVDPAASPRVIDDAWEIRRFDKLPTLRYNRFLRTAYL